MSVMSMIGNTSLDCSASLGLPRSAPLWLSGDGQSLSADYDIRQRGRDLVSSVVGQIMTSPPCLKGIANEIPKDNTVRIGIELS